MTGGLNLDALLDALAERVAARLAPHLAGRDAGAVRARLLSVEDAAAYIGRTKASVQHMVASGRLPSVRSDRRVFVDRRDLDMWIQDNKHTGL